MEQMVSVVMSVLNGERYLGMAIESILSQSEKNFEFIIINDGSTDGSADLLEKYGTGDPRIRVVHQANRGLVESLNLGCGLARARYIARMDADDIALPDRLRLQLEFMEANPNVALLGGAIEFIDSRGGVLGVQRPPAKNEDIQRILVQENVFFHPAVMFRRDAVLALGGYRHVPHAEDYDLWLRFTEHSSVANLTDVVLQYRLHTEQVGVRRCHEQAFAATAARAAALARRAGQPDPLATSSEITAEFIARLGISDAVVQTELARNHLCAMRTMVRSGQHGLALESLEKLPFSRIARAKRWVIADLHLMEAQLHWRSGRLFRCILCAGRSVMKRPAILGRPLKRLLISGS